MNNTVIPQFNVIGIHVRTTNENGQGIQDIGALWGRFMSENILAAIPNKVDNTIYSVYTDYESDYTKPYTTILGCKVENLDQIPDGMVGKVIDEASYLQFSTTGNLADGIVGNKWGEIWNMDINRAYTSDFEVYDEKAQDPANATVDIFIAVLD